MTKRPQAIVINALPLQAIATKYHGATNTRGARIEAKAGNGQKLSVAYDYNGDQSHIDAAMKLARVLGWNGEWAMGASVNTGLVFVLVNPAK